MTDLNTLITDLRAKAEAASKPLPRAGSPLAEHTWSAVRGEFYDAANPAAILALCDALEARDAEIAILRALVEKLESAYYIWR